MADLKSNLSCGRSKIQRASGDGLVQGDWSELRYVLASYWMPTLRVSSDDYSFRRTGVILDAYFRSMLPTFKSMLHTLRVCYLL